MLRKITIMIPTNLHYHSKLEISISNNNTLKVKARIILIMRGHIRKAIKIWQVIVSAGKPIWTRSGMPLAVRLNEMFITKAKTYLKTLSIFNMLTMRIVSRTLIWTTSAANLKGPCAKMSTSSPFCQSTNRKAQTPLPMILTTKSTFKKSNSSSPTANLTSSVYSPKLYIKKEREQL